MCAEESQAKQLYLERKRKGRVFIYYVYLKALRHGSHQSRKWVDGLWVMGQMGHENGMGHMGHGSLGDDP